MTEKLESNFVELHGDFFAWETIMEFNEFDKQLAQRKGKPFYVPEREELLRYTDDFYFQINKEYIALRDYVKIIANGDGEKAEMVAEDVQGICQMDFSVEAAFNVFNRLGVKLKNKKQISKVMELIMELANHTRLWENNGHTPAEIYNRMEKPYLNSLPQGNAPSLREYIGVGQGSKSTKTLPTEKIGRNDPCPCGSGKKYKKCCLNKE